MEGKHKLHILCVLLLCLLQCGYEGENTIKNEQSCRISVHDIRRNDHIKIEITQFSKLLLEIFGIDSELNYDLIVVQPIFDLGLQKIWRPNSVFTRQILSRVLVCWSTDISKTSFTKNGW